MMAFWLKYGKSIVAAVLGVIATPLAAYYGHDWWWPVATGVATLAGVYKAPANKDQGTLLDTDAAGAGLS